MRACGLCANLTSMALPSATPDLFVNARRYVGALEAAAYPKDVRALITAASKGSALGGKRRTKLSAPLSPADGRVPTADARPCSFSDPLAKRDHMRLQAHKPVPLPECEPDFEEDFVPRKGDRSDRDKRETRASMALFFLRFGVSGPSPPLLTPLLSFAERLRHEYKREFKGAVRELRKDNRFLGKVKLHETLENDKER